MREAGLFIDFVLAVNAKCIIVRAIMEFVTGFSNNTSPFHQVKDYEIFLILCVFDRPKVHKAVSFLNMTQKFWPFGFL